MRAASSPESNTVINRASVLVLVAALLFCCAAPSGAAPEGDLFPEGLPEGSWRLDGKPVRYTSENLYVPINGEAELYFPYGFKVLYSATYVKSGASGTAMTCEAFQMGSLLDAFGIYSNYVDPEAETVAVGGGGFVTESQLMFFKGPYFVRLSVSGSTAEEKQVFLAFAGMIASRIPGNASRPAELDFLRVPGLIAGTERYLAASILGYTFFKRGMVAEVDVEGGRAKIFVLLHDSGEAAQKSLDGYLAFLAQRGIKPSFEGRTEAPWLFIRDPLYGGVAVIREKTFLVGAAKVPSAGRGRTILDDLQSHLPKEK